MDLDEVIKELMEALGDKVADYDAQFAAIRDAVKGASKSGTDGDVEDWKSKYDDLRKKYIDRFTSSFMDDVVDTGGDESLNDVDSDAAGINLEDLDFDGKTE